MIRFGNFIVYDALKKENPMQHKNKPGFRGKRIQNTAAITEEALAFKANGWTVALSLSYLENNDSLLLNVSVSHCLPFLVYPPSQQHSCLKYQQ